MVCLFDNGYDNGFGALANSLVKAGFQGIIHAGYRGKLPKWFGRLKKLDKNLYQLTPEITIQLTIVSANMHLGYYKPYFIRETFERYPLSKKVYYFDTDITVIASWKIFSHWLETGVCVCLDNNFHYVHPNHPWRKDWRKLIPVDEACINHTNQYFNSGFLGIERGSLILIERWISYTEKYIDMGGNVAKFEKDVALSFKGDQDLLNAAITVSADVEFSVMGKEAMGFTLPASLMFHAVGDKKPWDKNFMRQLLRDGCRPSIAAKLFFQFSRDPINLFSKPVHRKKMIDLKFASALGRVIG